MNRISVKTTNFHGASESIKSSRSFEYTVIKRMNLYQSKISIEYNYGYLLNHTW